MPVYNAEAFVGEAIESILAQTFTDFELVVLNDGSTDSTSSIVSSYTDPRIIHHQNKHNVGIANNLNIGLKMANGEYIARFDGDDISMPDRLQIQVTFLDNHPEIGLCSAAMQLIGNESAVWTRDPHPEDVKITTLFYSPVLHASSMFRKELFLVNDLLYRQEAFPAEDYELWTRAIQVCRMVNLPQVLYCYRIHARQVPKNDAVAVACIKKIQRDFLSAVLPIVAENDVISFFDQFVYSTPKTVKELQQIDKLLFTILKANQHTKFFDCKRLRRRFKRIFAAKVFQVYRTNRKFDGYLLSKLRIRQLIKLLLHHENSIQYPHSGI